MKMLGYRNIQNTLLYTQLISFESDEFHSSTAATVQEAQKLIETGFEPRLKWRFHQQQPFSFITATLLLRSSGQMGYSEKDELCWFQRRNSYYYYEPSVVYVVFRHSRSITFHQECLFRSCAH